MAFEVNKEKIPLPTIDNRGRPSEYPFAQMEVGDSFDAPRDMGNNASGTDKRQNAIGNSARGYAKRHNPTAKFTARLIDENTVRCWRIA